MNECGNELLNHNWYVIFNWLVIYSGSTPFTRRVRLNLMKIIWRGRSNCNVHIPLGEDQFLMCANHFHLMKMRGKSISNAYGPTGVASAFLVSVGRASGWLAHPEVQNEEEYVKKKIGKIKKIKGKWGNIEKNFLSCPLGVVSLTRSLPCTDRYHVKIRWTSSFG